MHIQIFLVVVLLTLGTANKEESFADRTLLRQLLRDTQVEKADSSRRHSSDNSQKDNEDHYKNWLQKYLEESEDDSSGEPDSKQNNRAFEKYIKDLRKYKSDYAKGIRESQMGKDSQRSDEEWLSKFEEGLKHAKKDESDAPHDRRYHEDEDNADEDDSERRRYHQDEEDDEVEYLEVRATNGSGTTKTGPTITLQNRAVMNTRLRVLYTDENCSPFLAESGLLWFLQSKSVTLPTNARNVKIIVEKDLFAENWRVAYNGTLSDVNKCIRITGTTFSSNVKPCK